MEVFEIAFGEHVLKGEVFGGGPHLILCLHGFGNNRRMWGFLKKRLPEGVRMAALDMPFFGESEWSGEQKPPGAAELKTLVEQLQATFPDTTHLHLLGFSLGAKFALGIFQHSPSPIHSCLLISPDGLRIHPLYRFCIYNPIGRPLFKWTIRRPGFLLFGLRILYNLKIADAFKYRFVKKQFESRENRDLLRNVWIGYSNIRPDLKRVAERTVEWGTHWHVIWGEKDGILPTRLGRDFEKQVPGSVFHLVEGGHRLLHPPKQEVLTLIDTILKEL